MLSSRASAISHFTSAQPPAVSQPTPDSDLVGLYPVLGNLPPEAHALLAKSGQRIRLPAGTAVFDERQHCQGFPFVLRGGIRVVKAAANGRELPLYRVTPGETCVITSSCLLGHTDYNARGVTEDETKQAEKDLQKLTDDYIAKIDKHFAAKEKELMTV